LKKYAIFLILNLIVTSSLSSSDFEMDSISPDLNDIDILVLISDDCGWNYFVVNETLHEMGVNVITMTNTESYTVSSCPNKEQRPITADLLLSEFDLENTKEYDGIMITSGGQWRYFANASDVDELLEVAYDNGLVIGSICNGGSTVARSDINMNGTKIVRPLGDVYQLMKNKSAIIISHANVVSDRRIITGDLGDGPPAGYLGAPTYEVCLEMVKAITGQSYVANSEVVHNNAPTNLEYEINVEIANLSEMFPEFNVSDVQEVTANIYSETNSSDIIEAELTYIQETNQYSMNFTAPTTGKYIVDLDIMNEEYTCEVVRNATTFIAGEEANDSSSITLLLLGGGLGGVIIVILAVFWKRKK
jgi:putative intracellular protease/amidase